MKKGFTLVEILAVLIILAVIGLIAIPVVSTIINNSQKEAAEMNLRNVVRAATDQYRSSQMDDMKLTEIDLTTNELRYDGERPSKGYVYYSADGDVYVKMYYEGYCLVKEYDGDFIVEKTTSGSCIIERPVERATIEGLSFYTENPNILYVCVDATVNKGGLRYSYSVDNGETYTEYIADDCYDFEVIDMTMVNAKVRVINANGDVTESNTYTYQEILENTRE